MRDFLQSKILDNRIEGYPYPAKFCPFCERDLSLLKVMHYSEHPEIFKAIYACGNPFCSSYDADAKMSYARVYYSCQEAVTILELTPIEFMRKSSTGEVFKDEY